MVDWVSPGYHLDSEGGACGPIEAGDPVLTEAGPGAGFGGKLIRRSIFVWVGVVVLIVGAALCFRSAPVSAEPQGKADAAPARHVPASMSAKEYDAML
jgi:hypothetical protein